MTQRSNQNELPIRVLIADDHTVVREGLELMLRPEPDIEVVGDAVNGREAVDKSLALRPDIVMMDLHMPIMDGIESMRMIRQSAPEIEFVMLSAHGQEEEVLLAIETGARAYLMKNSSRAELVRAIRGVADGQSMLDPAVTATVLDRLSNIARGGGRVDRLSPRETEVLELLAGGGSNKEIAAQLNITENTVKTSLSRLYNKLGVNSRTQAVTHGLRRGILKLK